MGGGPTAKLFRAQCACFYENVLVRQWIYLVKVRKNQELSKEHEKQRKLAQDAFEQRESAYKDKIHELEGKVLREQEERARLAREVEELRAFQHEVWSIQASSGVPFSLSHFHQQRLDDADKESEGSRYEVVAAWLNLVVCVGLINYFFSFCRITIFRSSKWYIATGWH